MPRSPTRQQSWQHLWQMMHLRLQCPMLQRSQLTLCRQLCSQWLRTRTAVQWQGQPPPSR